MRRPPLTLPGLIEKYLEANPGNDLVAKKFRLMRESLERFAARPLTSADLNLVLFNRFVRWLKENAVYDTLCGHRSRLRELWHWAADHDLAGELPIELRKVSAGDMYAMMEDGAEGLTLRRLVWEKYFPVRRGLRRPSAEQIEYTVRSLYRFWGRAIMAHELTEEIVMPFIAWLTENRTEYTARRSSTHLTTLWHFAYRRKLVADDVPLDYDPPRVRWRIPKAWTLEEASRILDACLTLKGKVGSVSRPDWWLSLFLAGYDTGARVGALRQVKPTDIDMKRRRMVLRADVAKTGVEQIRSFSEATAASIERIWDPDREFVWEWPHNRRSFSYAVKRVLRDSGVDASKGVGFHRMRKTCATQTVMAVGWDQARLALGHTNESMTRRYVDIRQLEAPEVQLPNPLSEQARAVLKGGRR